MSTDSPIPESTSSTTPELPFKMHTGRAGNAKHSADERVNQDSQINQELILETRNQIRQMVEEITQLSQSDCDKVEFYEGFLTRCTQALASVGGAIWHLQNGGLSLEYQINLGQTNLTDEKTRNIHDALLGQLFSAGEPRLILPNSGNDSSNDSDDQFGNPTEHLLVVVPLIVNQKTVGLIEIFQRPNSGPATQRGYLRFLDQMGGHANNFLSRFQLREFDGRQQMWQQLDQFIRSIHENLNVDQSLFAIANEGRRVIQCDRVSVALKQGSGYQIKAVSGLDSIERRADQIKRLNKLTKAATFTQETLWYSGDDRQLPPQIEKLLHDYIDISHSKIVGIIPLRKTRPEAIEDREDNRARRNQKPAPIIGAMIVEQLGEESLDESLKHRSQAVAEHGGYALSNAIDHNSILFAGLWKRLGQMAAIVKLRNLPKTLLVAGTLVLALLALCLIPASFDLGATGELKPEKVHEVYARTEGRLMEFFVPDNPEEMVRKGQRLARLEDSDLQAEYRELQGQLKQSIERIEKFNRAQNSDLDQVELYMMESEMDEAFVSKATYERLLEMKEKELSLLDVTAPEDGHVVNWKLRENLIRRPVQVGQNLMTLVDPNTEWRVELELPERRTMHLLNAMKQSEEPLQVTFTLASQPGSQFQGTIADIDRRLDVHTENGNTLKTIVVFDKANVPPELLRDGTRVTAKIDAGTRSLGYVWLHELFETVQSSVMFWF